MKAIKYLLLLLCISFLSCKTEYSKQWGEVTKIGNINQGNYYKLEPLKDSLLILSGTEFSITNISFKCISLQAVSGMKFKSVVSIPSSFSTNVSSFETMKSEMLDAWPNGTKELNITIPITILPTFQSYKGKGNIYFYLVDSADNCISNIIEWKIQFK